MLPLLIFHGITIGLFLLLGILFSRGKGAWLIAGYNTASPWERDQYDEKKLCGFMGKFMFLLAACWLPILLSSVLDQIVLLFGGLLLFFLVTIGGVIYANTGNRFKK